MSMIRRAAALVAETRGADGRLPWGDSSPPPSSLVGANASGIPVTQNVAAGIGAVYSCCSLIADSVASLPLELRNGSERKTSKLLPLSPLLIKPYAELSRRDWWIQFIWSLALRGNFFGRIIERDFLGHAVQIKPIGNDSVQIWRDRATGRLIYRFYGEEIPLEDVVHARYQSMSGEIIGLNPIQLLALTFGNAVAKERFVESFYLNSANPMGVIEVEGYLDRAETRKMLRSWVAAHQGLNKANLPAVLTEGATFRPITIAPNDAQLIEALQFSESQICGRIFRVPPHMIGIMERLQGLRGIEQLERNFFANTLVGYLQIGMETLTAEHRTGQFVHFDTTKRERGATLERAQAGALGMNSGFFLADEVRDWFDLPKLPSGDGEHSFMPINTQLLDTAMEVLKQTKALPLTAPNGNGGGAGPASGTQGATNRIPGPSDKPSRRPSPNGLPRSEDSGNGMTTDEAWFIVKSAVEQAQRQRSAIDLAYSIAQSEEE